MSTGADAAPPARAIIVVGPNRSGTKWLSNVLCNHPDVAGVQSQRARGILETNMFHRMQSKFDLRRPEDYMGLIELWSRTEFFRLAHGEVEHFFSLAPRPLSMVTLFGILMTRLAAREGRGHWLQKVSPEHAQAVTAQLGSPRIVTITRDPVDTLRSRYQMFNDRGAVINASKAMLRVMRERKLVTRLAARTGALALRYEQLRADRPACIRRACQHIGLDYDDSMLEVPYQPNTSFDKNQVRAEVFSTGQTRWLELWAACLSLTPHLALQVVDRLRQGYGQGSKPLVAGTFGDGLRRLADKRDYLHDPLR